MPELCIPAVQNGVSHQSYLLFFNCAITDGNVLIPSVICCFVAALQKALFGTKDR